MPSLDRHAAEPADPLPAARLIETPLQEAQPVQWHRHHEIGLAQKLAPRLAHQPDEQRQGSCLSSNLKRTMRRRMMPL